MITGFNTDVRHRGVVFHVQTEDKGLSNPCVESLVYVGGQIVGRKRTGYMALVEQGRGKEEILDLIERQHRETIAEIRAGKLDAQVTVEAAPAAPASRDTDVTDSPARPTSPETAPADGSPSLDQVILDYLSSEAEQEHLVLMMDSPTELKRGEEAVLTFQAKSSTAGSAVPGTSILVTLISTATEPASLGKGSTDDDGRLTLRVEIPAMAAGSAALIVTAKSHVGTAEIKHLV